MGFKQQYALFEDTLDAHKGLKFYNVKAEIIAYTFNELIEAFDMMAQYQSNGYFLTGYVSYKASFYLCQDMSAMINFCVDAVDPLLHFIAFDRMDEIDISSNTASSGSIGALCDSISNEQYKEMFAQAQLALKNGDSYQINLTKYIYGKTSLSALELYNELKSQQKVRYNALLSFNGLDIISISPELFFRKNGTKLTVNPMKGTAKIGNDEKANKLILNRLKECKKNRSENLIIVDLLRNDMSAISKTGSVKVETLFEIETYQSILQMTSKISSKVKKNITFRTLLNGLFPCGSITGAPKLRTISLINQIELYQRNVYTGSIGYILPNNDMCFNVAIRTVEKQNDTFIFGVGGGITVSSTAQDEWDEMQTKMQFIHNVYKPDFSLVECIYYNQEYKHLKLHLDRFYSSMKALFLICEEKSLDGMLKLYAQNNLSDDHKYKVHITLALGKIEISHQMVQKNIISKLVLCPEKVDANNILFNHKTNHDSTRGFYIRCYNQYILNNAEFDDTVELLFMNQENCITETRFHNIFIKKNNKYFTPPISDGVLPGVYRAKKAMSKSIQVIEKSLHYSDLLSADKIFITNSIQGQQEVIFEEKVL